MEGLLEYYRRPVSKDEINTLPVITYEGRIFLVQTENELIDALEVLKNETVLGFDTEARPSFKKGISYPRSIIQLAGSQDVVIIQLMKVSFGPLLARLLSCPYVIKVGVAIHEDIRLLQKSYFFEPRGIIDIADIARRLHLKTQGLRNLAANLLGGRISKTAQCSNWQQDKLSLQQIRYAATDAWVGRELYLKLAVLEAQI